MIIHCPYNNILTLTISVYQLCSLAINTYYYSRYSPGGGGRSRGMMHSSNTFNNSNSFNTRGSNSNNTRGSNSNSARGSNSNSARGSNSNSARGSNSNNTRGSNSNNTRGSNSNSAPTPSLIKLTNITYFLFNVTNAIYSMIGIFSCEIVLWFKCLNDYLLMMVGVLIVNLDREREEMKRSGDSGVGRGGSDRGVGDGVVDEPDEPDEPDGQAHRQTNEQIDEPDEQAYEQTHRQTHGEANEQRENNFNLSEAEINEINSMHEVIHVHHSNHVVHPNDMHHFNHVVHSSTHSSNNTHIHPIDKISLILFLSTTFISFLSLSTLLSYPTPLTVITNTLILTNLIFSLVLNFPTITLSTKLLQALLILEVMTAVLVSINVVRERSVSDWLTDFMNSVRLIVMVLQFEWYRGCLRMEGVEFYSAMMPENYARVNNKK